MNAYELTEWIAHALQSWDPRSGLADPGLLPGLSRPVLTVRSFCDHGIHSSGQGVVIRVLDGDEFQIVVVQSRHAPQSEVPSRTKAEIPQ